MKALRPRDFSHTNIKYGGGVSLWREGAGWMIRKDINQLSKGSPGAAAALLELPAEGRKSCSCNITKHPRAAAQGHE